MTLFYEEHTVGKTNLPWGPQANTQYDCLMTKPTKWHVRPTKTQIRLGTCPIWSESLLSAWRKFRSLATHWAPSKDSDQTGRMPRLIWVFAGRTCHFVGFVMTHEVAHIYNTYKTNTIFTMNFDSLNYIHKSILHTWFSTSYIFLWRNPNSVHFWRKLGDYSKSLVWSMPNSSERFPNFVLECTGWNQMKTFSLLSEWCLYM